MSKNPNAGTPKASKIPVPKIAKIPKAVTAKPAAPASSVDIEMLDKIMLAAGWEMILERFDVLYPEINIAVTLPVDTK